MTLSRSMTIVVLMLLATSACAPSSTLEPLRYNRSMQAFEFSQDCPVGCFLGIKPLVTTTDEALRIFQNSPDIDQSSITIREGGLTARWAPTSATEWGFFAGMSEKDGLVDEIGASPIETSIGDFVNVIGEPDKIKVKGVHPADAPYYVETYLYYSEWKLLITNFWGCGIDGPKPQDSADLLQMNHEILPAEYVDWKGFGRMRFYMPADVLQGYVLYGPTH